MRTCEAWLAGETKIPSDALSALLQSEWGVDFLAAIMERCRPRWWQWLLRLSLVASIRRRREADKRLLQDALNADYDLSATIAKADAALFQDEIVDQQMAKPRSAVALLGNLALAAQGTRR